jgi:hypothetical protein
MVRDYDPDVPLLPRRPDGGLQVWVIVVIVVVCVGALIVAGAAAVVVPRMRERQRQIDCMHNLSSLAQTYLVASQERPESKPPSGPALWFAGLGKRVEVEDAKKLCCPADTNVHAPEVDADCAKYERVDRKRVPRSLCSYAARDFERFPLDKKSPTRQPIGACLCHPGFVLVAFEGGDVQILECPDDFKTVGPNSKSPVLRVLRFGDGSVR